MENKKEVVIVPHTHWDREWYKPFQEFRHQLVHLIDRLIDIFETQPDYYFMLDGQTIILEDYLEVRPEKKNRILELIREGRIDVGPWYLLPDEWLVSGESLIRNLEYSYTLAKKYQIPLMSIAYLPDMFGHSKAIPRILLDLTNLQTAVVWRGVGDEIKSDLFLWKSDKESEEPQQQAFRGKYQHRSGRGAQIFPKVCGGGPSGRRPGGNTFGGQPGGVLQSTEGCRGEDSCCHFYDKACQESGGDRC